MGGNLTVRQQFWRWAGASVAGLAHEAQGIPCEDSWRACQTGRPEGTQIVAVCVCDGAGSASRSAAGARLVSWAVAAWLSQHFEMAQSEDSASARHSLVGFVIKWLRRAAGRNEVEIAAYASTVVAVAVRSDGAWVSAHLGDGAIVGRCNGGLRLLSDPMKGEFANETFFVTDEDAAEELRISGSRFQTQTSKPDGFVLFTDGLENALINRRSSQVAPALGRVLDWLDSHSEEKVAKALQSNIRSVLRETTGDDCTLVAMAMSEREGSE